jgi:hypothetical protein
MFFENKFIFFDLEIIEIIIWVKMFFLFKNLFVLSIFNYVFYI